MIVGYSGFVIIARTGDTRLDELACVDDLFVAVTDNVRAGGWRIGFLGPIDDTSPGGLANDLALETAAPAIALSVFDSDCAFATAAIPPAPPSSSTSTRRSSEPSSTTTDSSRSTARPPPDC